MAMEYILDVEDTTAGSRIEACQEEELKALALYEDSRNGSNYSQPEAAQPGSNRMGLAQMVRQALGEGREEGQEKTAIQKQEDQAAEEPSLEEGREAEGQMAGA